MKFTVTTSKHGLANFQVTVNGFIISVAMGPSQYSDAKPLVSCDSMVGFTATEVEFAVMRDSDHEFVTRKAWLDCFDEELYDDVAGWRDPKGLFKLVEWAGNQ